MKTYLLQNAGHSIDESVSRVLDSMSIGFDRVDLPYDHEEIIDLFKTLEAGIVILPSVWEDLLCVKILQEVTALKAPFEEASIVPLYPPLQTTNPFSPSLYPSS